MRCLTLALFLGACAVSSGCARPDSMLVDAHFTEAEEESIAWAVDEWYVATDGGVDTELLFGWERLEPFAEDSMSMEGEHATMHRVVDGTPIWAELDEKYSDGKKTWSGRAMHGGTAWSIVAVIDEEKTEEEFQLELRLVLLHELGHYYGVDHLDHGFMASNIKLKTFDQACIDQDTLDEICKCVPCGPNAAPTCED